MTSYRNFIDRQTGMPLTGLTSRGLSEVRDRRFQREFRWSAERDHPGTPGTTPQRRAYERLSLLAFGKCKCYLISNKSISLAASVSIEMLSELRNHEFSYGGSRLAPPGI